MNDIDYITSEDMIDELKRRHEAIVIIGLIDLDSDRVSYMFSHQGGLVKCLGLVEYASTKLRHDIIEGEDDRLAEGEEVE